MQIYVNRKNFNKLKSKRWILNRHLQFALSFYLQFNIKEGLLLKCNIFSTNSSFFGGILLRKTGFFLISINRSFFIQKNLI